MIEVINRELLIPREEFNIGTNYDDASEVRTFHLKRVTAGGIDLAILSFSLDMLYANDEKDSADLDIEVTEKDINLTLTVVNSMLQVPGSVIVQLRALTDDGTVKWTSYPGAFFVEDAINTPASYTGDLTVLERLEVEWNAAKDAETARVAAETSRVEAESEREEKFDDIVEDLTTREQELKTYVKISKSYAIGDSGIRHGEETDNSKYYSEQSALSAEAARAAAETATSAMTAVVPDIKINFQTGNLEYTDYSTLGAHITFSVNQITGDLEYIFYY